MEITLCGTCSGRGFTEVEDGNNWSPNWTKSVCLACDGRGCGPIPPDLLEACPLCHDRIPVRDVAPRGACRFCGAKLMLLPPKCFLPVRETYTHTLFHDNAIGAGASVNLSRTTSYLRGPRLVPAEDRIHLIHPGYDWPYSKVVSPSQHGSFTIELGRLRNVDGEIVETVASKAEVLVTQTLGRR